MWRQSSIFECAIKSVWTRVSTEIISTTPQMRSTNPETTMRLWQRTHCLVSQRSSRMHWPIWCPKAPSRQEKSLAPSMGLAAPDLRHRYRECSPICTRTDHCLIKRRAQSLNKINLPKKKEPFRAPFLAANLYGYRGGFARRPVTRL